MDPSTLYHFDESAQLVQKDTNEKYAFSNQAEYEKLAKFVIWHVQSELKATFNMTEVWIPENSNYQCNIFMTQDWLSNANKALVIIQGAGHVRAGIWSRSVCVNDSLTLGSMLPYIQKGISEGYSIIILNPNFTHCEKTKKKIPYNSDMISHSKYVWTHFIQPCPARDLFVVGHSCGGICTLRLVKDFFEDFSSRVRAVALTDSVHGSISGLRKPVKDYIKNNLINYAASDKPLDHPLDKKNGCVNVSAGHVEHEYTSGTSISSIFSYFQEKMLRNK